MHPGPGERSGVHDVGGEAAGAIGRAEHELSFWEWRIDAMVRLCFQAGLLRDFAELRRAIEELGEDAYERLSYYERWAGALARLLVEKGVVTEQELAQRVASLRAARAGADGELGA